MPSFSTSAGRPDKPFGQAFLAVCDPLARGRAGRLGRWQNPENSAECNPVFACIKPPQNQVPGRAATTPAAGSSTARLCRNPAPAPSVPGHRTPRPCCALSRFCCCFCCTPGARMRRPATTALSRPSASISRPQPSACPLRCCTRRKRQRSPRAIRAGARAPVSAAWGTRADILLQQDGRRDRVLLRTNVPGSVPHHSSCDRGWRCGSRRGLLRHFSTDDISDRMRVHAKDLATSARGVVASC